MDRPGLQIFQIDFRPGQHVLDPGQEALTDIGVEVHHAQNTAQHRRAFREFLHLRHRVPRQALAQRPVVAVDAGILVNVPVVPLPIIVQADGRELEPLLIPPFGVGLGALYERFLVVLAVFYVVLVIITAVILYAFDMLPVPAGSN